MKKKKKKEEEERKEKLEVAFEDLPNKLKKRIKKRKAKRDQLKQTRKLKINLD